MQNDMMGGSISFIKLKVKQNLTRRLKTEQHKFPTNLRAEPGTTKI